MFALKQQMDGNDSMPSMPLWGEPWSFDESERGTPAFFSSKELEDRLISALQEEPYSGHLGALLRANPDLTRELHRFLRSSYRSQLQGDAAESNKERVDMVVEVIMSLLLRTRHQGVNHFLTAVMSLFTYRCQVSQRFWDFLSRIKLVYGRQKTLKMALQLGVALTPKCRDDIPANAVGVIAVFDNLAAYRRAKMQHVLEARQNHMLESNQWLFLKNTYLLIELCGFDEQGAP